MKIVHISIYPPKKEKHAMTGGVASYTKNLVDHTPYRKEDKVFVLAEKLKGRKSVYKEKGVEIIRCFDRDVRFFYQILREVKKINPDLIHIQQELGLFGGVVTAYLLQWLIFTLRKYKTFITLHGVVSLKKINKKFIRENYAIFPIWLVKIAFKIIYKPLCFWSDKVIVHEKYFKNILTKEYKIPNSKIEIVHHGVENFKSPSKEDASRKLSIHPQKNICLFLGYFTGYKGVDLLVEGFAEYARRDKDAFLFIGAGQHPKLKESAVYRKEYERLKNKAENIIPEGQYRWVGFVDEKEIGIYYGASDVSIFPYTIAMSSSGPMAMAIGYEKPFLVSDVFKNIFPKKFTFARNKRSLAQKMAEFFNNKDLFQKEIVKMKNNRLWTAVGKKVFNIYKH